MDNVQLVAAGPFADFYRAVESWPQVSRFLSVIENEAKYMDAIALLRYLEPFIGANEKHPLNGLKTLVTFLIKDYEGRAKQASWSDPVATLEFLMHRHGLTQRDLPEIGSQGVVSEVLSRKRKLNVRQVKALSRRFKVSPAVFVGEKQGNAAARDDARYLS